MTTTTVAVGRGLDAASVRFVEELIPGSQKHFAMLDDQQVDPIELGPSETAAAFNNDWVQPEFGLARRTFDVNVRRLVTIARIEKESVCTDPEYGGQSIRRLLPGRRQASRAGDGIPSRPQSNATDRSLHHRTAPDGQYHHTISRRTQ